MTEMKEKSPHGIAGRILEANMIAPIEHTLTVWQYNRVNRFLKHHTPPSPPDIVDVIIVPATSPIFDRGSFDKRIKATVDYAAQYPNAYVLFSGKRPDESRATPSEKEPNYSEAAVMAKEAKTAGLGDNHIELEEESENAKDNVNLSLDKLKDKDPKSILIISSGYMGRRLDLYLQKELKQRNLLGITTFIFDADVAEDLAGFIPSSDTEKERKMNRILYEAFRLSKYRQKGDL
jgi:uncharacterized SAM-binding protein YcdF (DUF218 family)